MTVTPTDGKSASGAHIGADPSMDKSGGTSARDETIPTYAEATTASASQANATAPAPAGEHQRLYPFPSLGTTQGGYGQSPYQNDGTLRIAIVPGASTAAAVNSAAAEQGGLPLPGSQNRRGPRAGRRFCAAFFWAIVLYIVLALVTGAIIDADERAHHPARRPPPPHKAPTPPGWHHHHGDKDDGKHRHAESEKLTIIEQNAAK